MDIVNIKDYPHNPGMFAYLNHPVKNVDILGFVIESRASKSGYRYRIQDGTAVITCFLNQQSYHNDGCKIGELVHAKGMIVSYGQSTHNLRLDYLARVKDLNAEAKRILELRSLYETYDEPFFIPKRRFKKLVRAYKKSVLEETNPNPVQTPIATPAPKETPIDPSSLWGHTLEFMDGFNITIDQGNEEKREFFSSKTPKSSKRLSLPPRKQVVPSADKETRTVEVHDASSLSFQRSSNQTPTTLVIGKSNFETKSRTLIKSYLVKWLKRKCGPILVVDSHLYESIFGASSGKPEFQSVQSSEFLTFLNEGIHRFLLSSQRDRKMDFGNVPLNFSSKLGNDTISLSLECPAVLGKELLSLDLSIVVNEFISELIKLKFLIAKKGPTSPKSYFVTNAVVDYKLT